MRCKILYLIIFVPGSSLTVSTPGIHAYDYVWKSVEDREGYLAFRVRACSEAYVAFGRQTAHFNGYEVSFGANSSNKTCVIVWGEETMCGTKKELLDCKKYRQLWVSWGGSGIAAGQGELPGRHVLVKFDMPEVSDIGALSFTTAREKAGEWMFDEDLGK